MTGPGRMRDVPEVLARVAKELDLPTAHNLARELGGTKVYVARCPRPESLLARAVGLEAARRIAELFGPGELLIPLGPTARFTPDAVPAIRRMIEAGTPDQEIARAVHCHVRTVQRIRLGERHRQLDLADWMRLRERAAAG